MASNIAVIGTGYVGLVGSVGLADFGNTLVGVDKNKSIIEKLNNGIATIYEHDLDDYLARNLKSGRLKFTTEMEAAINKSDVIFLAVGTPSNRDGSADLSQLFSAVEEIVAIMRGRSEHKIIITKSTVPVGTNKKISEHLKEKIGDDIYTIVSNPEFLREGRAVYDFFHPDRVVIGIDSNSPSYDRTKEILTDIYRPLYLQQTPFVWCNLETAELSKYAANAFLATKITFINQMANLAEACGADIQAIARTMGMDGRISPKFLHPGPGYGGSCFPKDTRAVASAGDECGVNMSLIKEVVRANEAQKLRVVEKIRRVLGNLKGKTIAILGLSFKAETDDVRESPAIDIVKTLFLGGAKVKVHDPKAIPNFRKLYDNKISYYNNEFNAIKDADCLVILTEWNEYRNIDLVKVRKTMKGKDIVDCRNILDKERVSKIGLNYIGTGK
jgi:UDPglucose 6-dehydrogenase